MRRIEEWQPSKYEIHRGGLRGSRSPANLGVGSRLVSDFVAGFYDGSIPRYVSGRLLDLGCGRAPLYGLYRQHATDVTLLDWDNSHHPNPHLDVSQDINERLTLPSGAFDAVVLSDVLEHLPRPGTVLREVNRVLGPNGVLLLNTPFMYGVHEAPFDFHRYTRFALELLLSEADFDVIALAPLGGYVDVVTDLIAKFLEQVPVVGRPLSAACQRLTQAFNRTAVGRRVTVATCERFPLGYAAVARKRLVHEPAA